MLETGKKNKDVVFVCKVGTGKTGAVLELSPAQ
jgi:hypothetical protein